MCFDKIREIFGKGKVSSSPQEETIKEKKWWEKPPKKWWQFPFNVIQTSWGGLNMPKYQPCPQCHAGSKRQEKTLGGANYFCRKHRRFFIKA